MATLKIEDDGVCFAKIGAEIDEGGLDNNPMVRLRVLVDHQVLGSTVWTVEGARLLGRAILAMADTVADARRKGKR